MTITPDTIITPELLAGLDKCPFCGAEKQQENNQWSEFRCWTVIHINQLAVVSRSTRCVGCELTTLRDRVQELEAVVNDPEALWANWLRGTVKLPAGIGDVRKHQEHIERLVDAGDAVSERCEVDIENWHRAKKETNEQSNKHSNKHTLRC